VSKSLRLSVLVLILAACGREAPVAQRAAAVPPAPRFRTPPPNFQQGKNAFDAVQRVRAKVGEPFRVLNIRITDRSVTIQAQDPKKPENVDEYRVNTELEGPIPVRLFGSEDALAQNLFNPDDVALDQIPALIAEAESKIDIEGREFSGITIKRDLPFDEDIAIRVSYGGTRKSAFLEADRHGKHGKVH
jgi:hypothetical protein